MAKIPRNKRAPRVAPQSAYARRTKATFDAVGLVPYTNRQKRGGSHNERRACQWMLSLVYWPPIKDQKRIRVVVSLNLHIEHDPIMRQSVSWNYPGQRRSNWSLIVNRGQPTPYPDSEMRCACPNTEPMKCEDTLKVYTLIIVVPTMKKFVYRQTT